MPALKELSLILFLFSGEGDSASSTVIHATDSTVDHCVMWQALNLANQTVDASPVTASRIGLEDFVKEHPTPVITEGEH